MPATRTRTRAKANGTQADTSSPKSHPKARSKTEVLRKSAAKPHLVLNPLPTLLKSSRPAADVYVWGKTGFGQLGLGSSVLDDILKPRKHPWVAAQVPLGTFGTEPGAGIVYVASGGMHTYLLDENGTIWSAGVNDNGALGRKSKSDAEDASLEKHGNDSSPVLESEFGTIETLVAERFRAVCVVAGDSFGCALDAHGELRSWGSFREGSEGDSFFSPTTAIQWLPTSLHTTGSSKFPDKIASISAGENHVLALTTEGEIYSWGAGSAGQLGRSRMLVRHRGHPQKVVLGRPRDKRKAIFVGTGMRSSFAIDQDGDVWAWGANGRGQLGLGSDLWGQVIEEPTKVEALSPTMLGAVSPGQSSEKIVRISGGEFHSVFLTSIGRALACGAIDSHELGLPPKHHVFNDAVDDRSEPIFHESSVCIPVEIPFSSVENSRLVSISSNMRYNMAITQQGALFSWGTGDSLGLGKDVDGNAVEMQETPAIVVRHTGPRRAISVSSGGQHVVALLAVRNDTVQ